jgi:ElaB/YqjD/DUF883 family membrane-anchored ribosome-binding protein
MTDPVKTVASQAAAAVSNIASTTASAVTATATADIQSTPWKAVLFAAITGFFLGMGAIAVLSHIV